MTGAEAYERTWDKTRDLAEKLAARAEDVCRKYLSAGRREGAYWLVGNLDNEPGRSLYVRLYPAPGKTPGRWADAATAENGDLFDLIGHATGAGGFTETLEAVRAFLGEPASEPAAANKRAPVKPAHSSEIARALFDRGKPARGTLVEIYLASRGITAVPPELRFDPRCYHAPGPIRPVTFPAMLAPVTDVAGVLTGVHRTWLARTGRSKAPVETQKKTLGPTITHGVRFAGDGAALFVGEGIETVLSVRGALPKAPLLSGLSAAHLRAVLYGPHFRRLYIVEDQDEAGRAAANCLAQRALADGLETRVLRPLAKDLNVQLRAGGARGLGRWLVQQLHPEDVRLVELI